MGMPSGSGVLSMIWQASARQSGSCRYFATSFFSTSGRTKKFDKRLRFTLSNRIDEKALDVLEAIVEANEINPAIETDPQRRAKLCMVRFDLQTSALTGCKMLLIFLDIAKTHGQIDNRACEFWTKRVLDVKYMTAAWRKKDAARFR